MQRSSSRCQTRSGKNAVAVLALLLFASPLAAEVRIDGLGRTAERLVLGSMRLADEPCTAPEWRVRRLHREADAEIRRALEVFGHYDVTIESTLQFNEGCWAATFRIDEGPRVTLREVEVRVEGPGGDDEVFRRLARQRPFGPQDGLDQQLYENYKRRFADTALQRGYFDARFEESRIDVYPDQRAADITLVYRTGDRYRFGEIVFDQDILADRLVESYVTFEAGEPYDSAEIGDLYSALLETGYFAGVDIRTDPRAAERDVPVRIVLTAANPRTWSAGVGFGTDIGPKIRSGFLHRRLNARGHQLELAASLSPVVSEAGGTYRLPLDDPRAEWLSFSVGYRDERPDTSRSELFEAGVRAIRRRPAGWLETRFLDFRYERFTVGVDEGISRLVIPGLNWVHSTGTGAIRPERAHRVSFQVSGTGEFLGSSSRFAQFEAFGRVIRPLWSGARVLARAEFGTTAKDDFRQLPFSVRYFAGGDNSVRGYDYKTLGPVDELGQVLGGSHKLVGSIEIDQRVAERWSVAAFYDVGNAFDSLDSIRLKDGVGAGIRWYSPLGPVRLDVAFPLSAAAPDSFRIHITLGPDL